MNTFSKHMTFFLALLLMPASASGLEKLSEERMKHTTAQAGIDMAIADLTVYHSLESLKIINTEDPDADATNFIEFIGLESLTTLDVGVADVNGDGYVGHFTFDCFTVNDTESPIDGKSLIYMKGEDCDLDKSLTIDAINFCGTHIGSAAMETLSMPSFHAYIGAHDAGVDIEVGAQIKIDEISFNYNPGDALKFSHIYLAASFSEEGDINDPLTWSPRGEFTWGDVLNGNPMTLDVGRRTDGEAFIAMNIPMKGSVRVDTMEFGGTDLGSFVMDDIHVRKLYIEMPGRGLGVPHP